MRVTGWDHDGSHDTYVFELTWEEAKLWGLLAGNTVRVEHNWYGDERETDWYENATGEGIEPPESLPGYKYSSDYFDEVLDAFDTAYREAYNKRKIDDQIEAAKADAIKGLGGGITPPLFTTLEEAEAWLETPTPATTRDRITRVLLDHLAGDELLATQLTDQLLTVMED